MAGGVEQFQDAAAAADGDEAAHDGADAGAIDLRDAGKIDEDFAIAGFDERAQFVAQLFVAAADGGASLNIEDYYVSRLPAGNLQPQAKLLLPTDENNAKRLPAALYASRGARLVLLERCAGMMHLGGNVIARK